ncbi:MAG TPA: TonB family protein [Pyrinomonadaceae bacterium]|nr:TonB family protein [Pyrinomonadaceae bacterium]
MSRPRSAITGTLISALLVYVALGSITGAHIRASTRQQQQQAAAPDDTARAIKLYEKGDLKAAIEALRKTVKLDKDNANAWHYLGLALNRMGRIKEARKAFETAVKLNPNFSASHTGWAYTLLLTDKKREALGEARRALALNARDAVAHYIIGVVHLKENELSDAFQEAEASLRLDARFWPALLLKAQSVIGLFVVEAQPPGSDKAALQGKTRPPLREAVESIEKYLQFNGQASDAKLWREQLEELRPHAESMDKPDSERTVFTPREVTTKARILTRPEPQYTDDARQAGIEGKVVLRAIFGADGQVRNILLLRHLDRGLSEMAIRAARGIKFVPATKDGRPVSQLIQIEYNFHLY